MAAADYFDSGARPSASHLAPPQPQRASSNPNMNFGPRPQQFSHTPPFSSPQPHLSTSQFQPQPPYGSSPSQYGDERPGVHLAPPPAELSGRHSFSSQRPHPQQWNQPFPPPLTSQSGQPVRYNPQAYVYQHPPHPAPHTRPHNNNYHPEASLMGGYSSDPEPHRRRHKHDKKKRRISEASRSAKADGFIGAAGGGLIGDLIFPGLGTAAGALVGWIGGKDYGEHRKSREEQRDKVQEAWHRKYSSRDRSHDERRSSRDHSNDGRRRSHDGRRGDY